MCILVTATSVIEAFHGHILVLLKLEVKHSCIMALICFNTNGLHYFLISAMKAEPII